MAIMVSGPTSKYTPAPEGTHAAVCCDAVDLGKVKTEWKGQVKFKRKVKIVWQIEEEHPETGFRFTVSRRFNASLHENATLRKVLKAWRGKDFTEEEILSFDVEKLIGVPCQILIVHNAGDEGKIFANVESVMPVGKGGQRLQVAEYVREVDREPQETESSPVIGDDDIPF